MSGDPHRLERFVEAQDEGGTYARAVAELRAGHKRTHWFWFVFPQLAGLGRSPMARSYAIGSPAEARAYLAHPLLGPRLRECGEALLTHAGTPAAAILGEIDAVKLRSSLTLFARADPEEPLFRRLLDEFCEGEQDPLTVELLDG